MNIRKTINKLQKALVQHGYIYKINTYQFFTNQQNRMITGYRITEKHKNDSGRSEEISSNHGEKKKEK